MKADTGSEYLFFSKKKSICGRYFIRFLSNFACSKNQGIHYIIIGTMVISTIYIKFLCYIYYSSLV